MDDKILTLSGAKQIYKDLRDRLDTTDIKLDSKIDEATVEEGYLILKANGNEVTRLTGFGGGGGSGSGGGTSSNEAKLTVTKSPEFNFFSKTIASGDLIYLKFLWSSIEDGAPTGDGGLTIKVNGVTKANLNISQGEVSVEVSKYLSTGTNNVMLTVSDQYSNTRNIATTIIVVSLDFTVSFDESKIYKGNEAIITYTAKADGVKTIHFVLDEGTENEKEEQEKTSSISRNNYTLKNLTHGAHDLKIYYDVAIDGNKISCNPVYYSFLYVEDDKTETILSARLSKISDINQYDNLNLYYTVYNPSNPTTFIDLRIDSNGEVKEYHYDAVPRILQTWPYSVENAGETTITISSGDISKSFSFDAEMSSIYVEDRKEDLELYLTSNGRSNNEENKDKWMIDDSTSVIFNNFKYNTVDGWISDENGITSLRISGEANIEIPFKIFSKNLNTKGKSIEIEFSTTEVLDYETTIISCMNNGIGFMATPQYFKFVTNTVTMETQFKEDEHIRISLVIESNNKNNPTGRLVYCYINGICSGVSQYGDTESIFQNNPQNIFIGSNKCTVNLYNIRIYDIPLSKNEVLNNWIYDTQLGSEKLDRFTRNNIYDGGVISLNKIKNLGYLPYMIIEGPELSQNKKDTKTVNVQYFDPQDPTKNFVATKATIAVQGTSSQYYARKNYKLKLKVDDKSVSPAVPISTLTVNGIDVPKRKYSLTDNDIAVSTFCLKADVASSEGANNVELVKLYNEIAPKIPPQTDTEISNYKKVRQGVNGFPIVVFWDNGIETSFLGKYNFNNDKSTAETFGFVEGSGDESWEYLNNVSLPTNFKSNDMSKWSDDIEARFPDTDPAYGKGQNELNKISEMLDWVSSTDTACYDEKLSPRGVEYHFEKTSEVLGESIVINVGDDVSEYYEYKDGDVYNKVSITEDDDVSEYFVQVYNKDTGHSYVPASDKFNESTVYYKKEIGKTYVKASIAEEGVEYYKKVASRLNPSQHFKEVWQEVKNLKIGESDVSNLYILDINPSTMEKTYTKVTEYKHVNEETLEERPASLVAEENLSYYKNDTIEYYYDDKEFRIEKFKNEVENWWDVDALVFNYLFSEFFLMVDNRAKNIFPSIYHQNNKWYIIPYDFDTAIGTDNVGALKFGYKYESSDLVDGSNDTYVFAGSDSVLYNNVRVALEDRITEMYKDLRKGKYFSYYSVNKQFEDHQSKWSEAIFNEDSWFKYIEPYTDGVTENRPDGTSEFYKTSQYFSMLQGSKENQRKWWLYNRFKYMDSKFYGGDVANDQITLRCYATDTLNITPYADLYVSVLFEGNAKQKRCNRGEVASIPFALATANNTPVYIYSASQLKDIGDLSGLKIGFADFTNGTRLERLKVGDKSRSYSNTNLTSLTIGNNGLLRELDVRNCPNLSGSLDISNCPNLQHLYLDGTSVSSISLPSGGILETIHLPSTINTLILTNQESIKEFVVEDLSNINKIHLKNVPWDLINYRSILKNIKSNAAVRLEGITSKVSTIQEIYDFINDLSDKIGIDDNGETDASSKAVVSGTIFLDSEIDYSSLTALNEALKEDYRYLSVSAKRVKCTVTFIDGQGNTFYSKVVYSGDNVLDPIKSGDMSYYPTKYSDVQFDYKFLKWENSQEKDPEDITVVYNIQSDLVINPLWTSTTRSYTYRYVNKDGQELERGIQLYGEIVPEYTGETPVYPYPEDFDEVPLFIGWKPDSSNHIVVGDCTFTALYDEPSLLDKSWRSRGNLSARKITHIVPTVPEDVEIKYSVDVSDKEDGSILAKGWANSSGGVTIAFVSTDESKQEIFLPKDSSYMFNSIDYISLDMRGLNTSKVVDARYMFYGCSNLEELDMSSLDFFKVTNITNLFYNNSKLRTLKLPKNINLDINLSNSPLSHKSIKNIIENLNTLDENNKKSIVLSKQTYLSSADIEEFTNKNWNISGYTLALNGFISRESLFDGIDTINYPLRKIIFTEDISSIPMNESNMERWSESDPTVVEDNTLVRYTYTEDIDNFKSTDIYVLKKNAEDKIYLLSENMFDRISTLKYLVGLEYTDIKYLTSLATMFQRLELLTELNGISNWDTSNITSMTYTFSCMKGVKILDISGWNTSNVSNMNRMFQGCESLTEIKGLESLDTSNVTVMEEMFGMCESLSQLNDFVPEEGAWNTSKLTNTRRMFYRCLAITSFNPDWIDMSNVSTAAHMFYLCSSLKELDLTSWADKISNLDSINGLFYQLESCKSINCAGWNTSNVTSFKSCLNYNRSLEYFNMSGWDTSKCSIFDEFFGFGGEYIREIQTEFIWPDVFDTNGSSESVLNMSFFYISKESILKFFEVLSPRKGKTMNIILNVDTFDSLSTEDYRDVVENKNYTISKAGSEVG